MFTLVVDYRYVDEAQDNLLIDALCEFGLLFNPSNITLELSVLRSLTRNPDGLFWAGDTAQTISVGSSFRFNDLKAFLFRLEVLDELSETKCRELTFFPSETTRRFRKSRVFSTGSPHVPSYHKLSFSWWNCPMCTL